MLPALLPSLRPTGARRRRLGIRSDRRRRRPGIPPGSLLTRRRIARRPGPRSRASTCRIPCRRFHWRYSRPSSRLGVPIRRLCRARVRSTATKRLLERVRSLRSIRHIAGLHRVHRRLGHRKQPHLCRRVRGHRSADPLQQPAHPLLQAARIARPRASCARRARRVRHQPPPRQETPAHLRRRLQSAQSHCRPCRPLQRGTHHPWFRHPSHHHPSHHHPSRHHPSRRHRRAAHRSPSHHRQPHHHPSRHHSHRRHPHRQPPHAPSHHGPPRHPRPHPPNRPPQARRHHPPTPASHPPRSGTSETQPASTAPTPSFAAHPATPCSP